MPYTISRTNGSVQIIADGSLDTTKYSIAVPGLYAQLYGGPVVESLVNMLENFASTSSPSQPIPGQLWYDTSVQRMKFNSGATDHSNTWSSLVSTDSAGNIGSLGSPWNSIYVDTAYADSIGSVSEPVDTMWLDGVISNPLHVVNKAYADTKLAISGGSMSGHLVLVGDPTLGLHPATKQYVDSVAQGFDPKDSCRVATTANITLIAAQVIDGVSVVPGDRVLVKNQSTASQNGIYVVASGAWARASDADGNPAGEVSSGMFTFVTSGTANAGSGWMLTTPDPIVLDVTALAFSQSSASTAYIGGSGVNIVGNTIEVDSTVIRDSGSQTKLGNLNIRPTSGSANGALSVRTDIAVSTDNVAQVSVGGDGGLGSFHGAGVVDIGGSLSRGGGLAFKGFGNTSTTLTDISTNYLTLYRRSGDFGQGAAIWTARNALDSNAWEFRDDVTVGGNLIVDGEFTVDGETALTKRNVQLLHNHTHAVSDLDNDGIISYQSIKYDDLAFFADEGVHYRAKYVVQVHDVTATRLVIDLGDQGPTIGDTTAQTHCVATRVSTQSLPLTAPSGLPTYADSEFVNMLAFAASPSTPRKMMAYEGNVGLLTVTGLGLFGYYRFECDVDFIGSGNDVTFELRNYDTGTTVSTLPRAASVLVHRGNPITTFITGSTVDYIIHIPTGTIDMGGYATLRAMFDAQYGSVLPPNSTVIFQGGAGVVMGSSSTASNHYAVDVGHWPETGTVIKLRELTIVGRGGNGGYGGTPAGDGGRALHTFEPIELIDCIVGGGGGGGAGGYFTIGTTNYTGAGGGGAGLFVGTRGAYHAADGTLMLGGFGVAYTTGPNSGYGDGGDLGQDGDDNAGATGGTAGIAINGGSLCTFTNTTVHGVQIN